MTKNRLYCGENLEILATMEAESVDLIYIDPPFKSDQDYNVLSGRFFLTFVPFRG